MTDHDQTVCMQGKRPQGCSEEEYAQVLTTCVKAWQILAKDNTLHFIDLYIAILYTTCCKWRVCSKSSENGGNKVHSYIHSRVTQYPNEGQLHDLKTIHNP